MRVIATDAWIDAMPEDVYQLCPCGCGKKFRFVIKENSLEEHEARFVKAYKEKKDAP